MPVRYDPISTYFLETTEPLADLAARWAQRDARRARAKDKLATLRWNARDDARHGNQQAKRSGQAEAGR